MSTRPDILLYSPNVPANVIFGVLYEAAAALLLLNLVGRRDWWALCLPIGAAFQGVGFFLRIPLVDNGNSLALYIPQQFCIVLAPACYFAFNYIWFGRLVQRLEENGVGERKAGAHLAVLSPRKYGVVFIVSDVVTFFIQAGGGGMQVQESLQKTGSTIFLIGIIAQFASYVVFCALAVLVCVRIGLFSKRGCLPAYAQRRMRSVMAVLTFSSLFILVRSGFRTVELAQGYDGQLSQTEAWFFGLDSAPLLLAIGVYIFAWPSSFLQLKQQSANNAARFTMPYNLAARRDQHAWLDASPLTATSSYDHKEAMPLTQA